MEFPKSNQNEKLKQFNFKLDEVKSKDVMGNDVVKVHDFFTNSKKISKMSDVFPQNKINDEDLLS
jgi:hypothetical protein